MSADELGYTPPPFTFDIHTPRGDVTSVAGKSCTGGISKDGGVFSLTFSGGPGRSEVRVWLPRAKAEQLVSSILAALHKHPETNGDDRG